MNWLRRRVHSEEIRLHLGCGTDYWRDYINVDNSRGVKCDLRLDFTRIEERFSANSVSEVAMIHSLSYLRLWEARGLFGTIHRLLRQGGRLIIELPDLSKCARKALAREGQLSDYLEAVRGLYAFDMDQIRNREMFTPYAFGWSSWHLRLELEEAGFRRIEVSDPLTHGKRIDRDIRVTAIKE